MILNDRFVRLCVQVRVRNTDFFCTQHLPWALQRKNHMKEPAHTDEEMYSMCEGPILDWARVEPSAQALTL